MPAPYPQKFREDVVAVARGRDAQTTMRQVVEDFGISEATLSNWLKAAEVEAGRHVSRGRGVAQLEAAQQAIGAGERGAAPGCGLFVAGESQTRWLTTMMYRLVSELADSGIPVTARVPGLETRPPALLPVARSVRDRRGVGSSAPHQRAA